MKAIVITAYKLCSCFCIHFLTILTLTSPHKFRGAFQVQPNKEACGYNPRNWVRSNLKGVLVLIHRAKPDQLESQVSGWLLHTSDQQSTPSHWSIWSKTVYEYQYQYIRMTPLHHTDQSDQRSAHRTCENLCEIAPVSSRLACQLHIVLVPTS